MLKTKKTKEIINEWRKFENKNRLNESQGALTRQRPRASQRALDLMKKLEDKYGAEGFMDYPRYFDSHSDEEMLDPMDGGFQIEHQEVADYVNSSGEFNISDMKLEDFVLTEDDLFAETGGYLTSIFNDIVDCGSFQGSDGTVFSLGKLDIDGEEIGVVYHNAMGGYNILKFIPSSSSSSNQSKDSSPSKSYKNSLGGAWG